MDNVDNVSKHDYITAIIELIQKDYPDMRNDKIRNILAKATFDEVMRTYDAIYRYGAKVIFDQFE